MRPSTRNILLSALVLVVVLCLCLGALGVGGLGVGVLGSILAPSATPTSTPLAVAPTLSATASPRPSQSPAPEPAAPPAENNQSPLPPAITGQMDEIQRQVIRLRGLQPTGPVKRGLLNHAQLIDKVKKDFFKDFTPDDAKDEAIKLHAFGLLPANFDLFSLYQRLYEEQVSGYYDNVTKEMYVVEGESFQGPERMTYAHEYTHVLQDQNFDMKDGLNYSETACKDESERCAAIQALIEGDASLVELDWFQQDSTALDQQQIQNMTQGYSSPVFDSAPDFLQKDFLFAYQSGLEFVQSLFDRGGWAAANDAFHNPPQSTEQILHPDRYPADKPVVVPLPDLTSPLGSGWRKVDENTLGEWYTYLVLADGEDARARLPANTAQTATAGWGGDKYAVFASYQGGSASVLVTQWDQTKDAAEFRDAFVRYGRVRWGSPTLDQSSRIRWEQAAGVGSVEFRVDQQRTTWVSAPDTTTLDSLLDALSKP